MSVFTEDLIFPEQANHDFGKILAELKRSTLTIHNRLTSIYHDSNFTEKISALYERPLIANERCGSWYVQPKSKVASAYFKSTDGHTGVWKFSFRRLNFHLLQIIGINDGCIIVDSTRRGKSMPDALSKTIPIWCAVLNRYLFPEKKEFHNLYTPPKLVSPLEHAQINALLPDFISTLKALRISPVHLRKFICKPLRPLWVTPDSVFEEGNYDPNFHPIICCTASRFIVGSEYGASGYIQGAGDDTENWAHGLTPNLFWDNREDLLSMHDAELLSYIENLVEAQKNHIVQTQKELRCIKPTSRVFVTSISEVDTTNTSLDSCVIILRPDLSEIEKLDDKITIGIGKEKLAARNLRKFFPLIIEFLESTVVVNNDNENTVEKDFRIIVACKTGMESSIGVALAILCLFFDDDGNLIEKRRNQETIDKTFIKSRLAWISTSVPEANPSRATLQSVNSFLMSRS